MPSPAPAGYRPHPLPAGQAFALPPRTLLLVEDSRLAAEAVRLICRRIGIRLRRTETLAGAALHLRVYRPDIVLVDLGLPDGSGLQLIAALARSTARPQRLVAISGDPRMEAAAMAMGADAFVAKPFTLRQHLTVLTGDAADLVDLVLPDPPYPRNAGGDPLALRDDLTLVRDLLNGPPDPDRLRYAGQFLASIGRSLRDSSLIDAAEALQDGGDSARAVNLLDERVTASPVL